MDSLDVTEPLHHWLRLQTPDATDVRVGAVGRVEFGHSAQMLLFTIYSRTDGREESRDVVLRARPPAPGLLEPYDLKRQFEVLRALESTPVPAPAALWLEESGAVLGRPFYVMERCEGEVYERFLPDELKNAPERIPRMARSIIETVAAIHLVDLNQTGLDTIERNSDFIGHELDHWENEVERVKRGPLPALERLLDELRAQQPDPSAEVTLVHGDPKGGNFAFVGDDVSAVFDWEMTAVGDPMADIGWAEVTWSMTAPFNVLQPAELDELLAYYQELTGIAVHDRAWYRAFQAYKMGVIMLVGSMLFDAGHSDDPRFADMAVALPFLTRMGLADLGVTEPIESGPVTPREERRNAVRAQITE